MCEKCTSRNISDELSVVGHWLVDYVESLGIQHMNWVTHGGIVVRTELVDIYVCDNILVESVYDHSSELWNTVRLTNHVIIIQNPELYPNYPYMWPNVRDIVLKNLKYQAIALDSPKLFDILKNTKYYEPNRLKELKSKLYDSWYSWRRRAKLSKEQKAEEKEQKKRNKQLQKMVKERKKTFFTRSLKTRYFHPNASSQKEHWIPITEKIDEL